MKNLALKKLGLKKLAFLLPATLAITLVAGGTAFAQGDNSIYFVAYFSNANTPNAPDGVLRLVNDGDAATTETGGVLNGTLYASLYVLDDSQVMQECCNCGLSSDGLLSESVNQNLMSNTLTGGFLETNRGVVKVISGTNNDPTNNVLKPGLRGWVTHIQAASNLPEGAPFYVSETRLANSNLSASEKEDLEMTCGFVMYLGSGQGVCSCTLEDQDF
jgi:hypothetical protein